MATEAMLQRLCRDKYALTRLYHSASIINILPQQEYENNNCKMDFFLWENTEWNIITKNQKSKSEKGEPKKNMLLTCLHNRVTHQKLFCH
jgi:hypothetical protein